MFISWVNIRNSIVVTASVGDIELIYNYIQLVQQCWNGCVRLKIWYSTPNGYLNRANDD